ATRAMKTSNSRLPDVVNTYTRDTKAADLHRLSTRTAREASVLLARPIDETELQGWPSHRLALVPLRLLCTPFTLALAPGARMGDAASLLFAGIGFFNLLRLGMSQVQAGNTGATAPTFSMPDGLLSVVLAFALVNLLVLLEVADRLSLKNDLEIAREIQK